jgi:hypothetical protein
MLSAWRFVLPSPSTTSNPLSLHRMFLGAEAFHHNLCSWNAAITSAASF